MLVVPTRSSCSASFHLTTQTRTVSNKCLVGSGWGLGGFDQRLKSRELKSTEGLSFSKCGLTISRAQEPLVLQN